MDHGAQFFTVREPGFQAMTDRWLARGTCFEWTRGFHQWDDGHGLRPPDPDDGHPRHACRAGMSALCKDLAGPLPPDAVRLPSKVLGVRWTGDHWQAGVEGRVPRRTRRTRAGGWSSPCRCRRRSRSWDLRKPWQAARSFPGRICGACARSETAPTLAVLLRGPAPAPDWQGIQLRDATLSWLSDDTSKRLPGEAGADRIFVLHGSGEFSRRWQDADLDEAARRMVARAGEIVGEWITRLPGRQVHRWRYASVPHTLEKAGFLRATGTLGAPLFFAGDGFLKGKIEGACRSGMLLAKELLAEMG